MALLSWPLVAQQVDGLNFNARMVGSASELGTVLRIDPTAGYVINRYFSVEGGVPVFIVRPSESVQQSTGAGGVNGIGNVFGTVRFTLADEDGTQFLSLLTVAAPTGDANRGLGTGRTVVDWTNFATGNVGKFRPFGSLGFANAISDTAFFVRPFFTHGAITHLEAGGDYLVGTNWAVGGSTYRIIPRGQQTLVSRVHPAAARIAGNGPPPGRGRPFLDNQQQTGSADLVRDQGVNAWWQIWPTSGTSFQIGYSRSTEYRLNTFFFAVGMHFGSRSKRTRHGPS
jgi:hypothetical protein